MSLSIEARIEFLFPSKNSINKIVISWWYLLNSNIMMRNKLIFETDWIDDKWKHSINYSSTGGWDYGGEQTDHDGFGIQIIERKNANRTDVKECLRVSN